MTREEAARVLETEHYLLCSNDSERKLQAALLIAIAALNEVGSPTTKLDENGLARCNWCGPERIGWFSVQFWVRACYGKRKWMSVTQDWKKKVKYCPMCGRKLEEKHEDA